MSREMATPPSRAVTLALCPALGARRFYIGLALALSSLASMYADATMPFEFVVTAKGKPTNVPVPFDPMSKRFVMRILLTAPLVVALLAHLCEPGLLESDKTVKKKKK